MEIQNHNIFMKPNTPLPDDRKVGELKDLLLVYRIMIVLLKCFHTFENVQPMRSINFVVLFEPSDNIALFI